MHPNYNVRMNIESTQLQDAYMHVHRFSTSDVRRGVNRDHVATSEKALHQSFAGELS